MSLKAVFAVLLVVGITFSLFIGLVVGASSSESMDFIVDVRASKTSIEISDRVYFGNISKGYVSDKVRIDINNTGDVAVKVTPQLVNSSEDIFSNLYFARRTTEPYYKIGSFNLNISQPSSIGGITEEYFYAKLDLSNFQGAISSDRLGHKAEVVFYALPI